MELLRWRWLLSCAVLTYVVSGIPSAGASPVREVGRCTMYGSCGKKGFFGGDIPCPDNNPARKPTDENFIKTLAEVCGPDFSTTTCCTTDQLETLSSSLAQAEPLLATCPACRSNFRHFYCSFTCSPDQSLFMTVTATQNLTTDGKVREAVKNVNVEVSEQFGQGFFDSCKDVKFGATNGYAMDLLGGGAKTYLAFLRYMGTVRALGSPFQIDFPEPSLTSWDDGRGGIERSISNTSSIVPFNDPPLNCSSPGLNARCACPDCPDVCAVLPKIRQPSTGTSKCHVGKISCFSFTIILLYGIATVGLILFMALTEYWTTSGKGSISTSATWTKLRDRFQRHPSTSGYDRVPMSDPNGTEPDEAAAGRIGIAQSNVGNGKNKKPLRASSNSLVGATSTSNALDGESSASSRRPPSGSSGINSVSTDASPSRTRLSRGASLLDPSFDPSSHPFLQPRTYPLNQALSSAFYKLGLYCARYPFLTLAMAFAVCGVANLGWGRFQIEKDPVNLWVAKNSESANAKGVFDEAFGPFYRTEQIFISNPAQRRPTVVIPSAQDELIGIEGTQIPIGPDPDPDLINWERLQWWAEVESQIRGLKSSPSNYSLTDVCFSPQTDPLPPTEASGCVVQSIMGYFDDTLENVNEDSWATTLRACAASPAECLPGSGQPMNPKLVLGRIPEGSSVDHAEALIVTYVLKNSLDENLIQKAEEWESTLQDFLHQLALPSSYAYREQLLSISYSTGVSLEEELNKSTNTDIPIVIISYVLMFFYVSINLGSSGAGLAKCIARGFVITGHGLVYLLRKIPLPQIIGGNGRRARASSVTSFAGSTPRLGAYFKRQLLVDSKFLLGLWGIVIVLLSVSTSVALFSAMGVKVTLIIAEVIPFLVLAIGVDNVFLLAHELDEQNARAYAALSRQGPLFGGDEGAEDGDLDSLPLAEERVARALARMGPSILLSAACETVAFGLGAMVGMPAVRNFAIYAAGAVVINALLQVTVFISAMAVDLRRLESNRVDCVPCLRLRSASSFDLGGTATEGFVARVIRVYYAPILLKPIVKTLVCAIFAGIFVLSVISTRHIELGLDQRLALPRDSYLISYFNALDEYLDVGPPVYFVIEGINTTSRSHQQQICGRFSTCEELSLANVLEAERKRPESSFLAEPPAIWLDDFFQWLNPLLEDCCRVLKKDPETFCTAEDPDFLCQPCYQDKEPSWNITMDGLPEGAEFTRYLQQWLKSPTDETCPLGGKAGYATALKLQDNSVSASHFRTYHTPLKTQADFINAMAAAKRISDDLSNRTGSKVFPYSLFYVFFDQYSHIVASTREVLTIALASVLIITSLFLGSWRTGCVLILTVFMTVISVMGMMGAWNINLNAISLVNLVVSVGIAVEFCSHICRAFMGALGGGLPYGHSAGGKDRDERARAALSDVGSSVFSGITITKLIGISVLALTRSELLEIFFFRMWLSLIVSGALHALVFLPVALSYMGGQGYALSNEDEVWIDTAVGRRYEHEGRPFLADEDDDSIDSDHF